MALQLQTSADAPSNSTIHLRMVAAGERTEGANRPVSEPAIRRLERDWDIEKMGPLRVARRMDRDGELRIFDGQHRFRVGVSKGVNFFPCEIVEVYTEKREAELWEAANIQRKIPTAIDAYHNKIRQGDPEILAIQGMLAKIGREVPKAKSGGGRYVNSVQLLRRLYGMQPEHLPAALEVAHEISGDKVLGDIIIAVAFFAALRGPEKLERLRRGLLLTGYEGSMQLIREVQIELKVVGGSGVHISQKLVDGVLARLAREYGI